MLKKITFAGLGLALLASPLLVSAQTTDLQSLIASLLAQVKALQAQIAQLQGQTGASASCLTLQSNLYLDQTDSTTNGEVSKLQQFLGGRVTGYYGPATLQLVQNWQSSHSVVSSGNPDTTGYGYVGPKTRGAMGCGITVTPPQPATPANPTTPTPPVACTMQYLMCPTGTHHVDGPGQCQQSCVQDTATGAPSISGIDAPTSLSVGQTGAWTVHASVANNANTQLRYSVIWGDEGVLDQINAFAGNAAPALQTSGSFTHAYATAGTYSPTFIVANDTGSAQTSASVTVSNGTVPPPTTGGSCIEGQQQYLKCPGNTACVVDPGWFTCRNGVMVRECTGMGCYNPGVPPGATSSGGSCVSYTTTYANGSTAACTVQPGPGIACPLGLGFSSWTCSNGQWVSAPQTNTPPTATGGSCVAYGHTFPNGTVERNAFCGIFFQQSCLSAAMMFPTWTCTSGQWCGQTGICYPSFPVNINSCAEPTPCAIHIGVSGALQCVARNLNGSCPADAYF